MRSVASVLLASALSLGAAQRTVLGELFTNWGCPPCRPADSTMDEFYPQLDTAFAVVAYHVWWPSSNDPFYLDNVSENRARTNYYGVNSVPNLHIDGIIDAGWDHSAWETKVLTRMAVPSPISMNINITYDTVGQWGWVDLTAVVEGTVPSTLRAMFALDETGLYAMGPNGWPYHNNTFRDLVPYASGVMFSNVSTGDTITHAESFTLPSYIQDWRNCSFVVWIQDFSSVGAREVLQTAKADLTSATAVSEDRAPTPAFSLRGGDGSVLLTLPGDGAVTVRAYALDGRALGKVFEGRLSAGEHELSLDGLGASGVLLVTVETSEGLFAKTAVVVRKR